MTAFAVPFLHAASPSEPPALLLAVLPALAWAYVAAASRVRSRGKRWGWWRTAAFLLGVALVGVSLTPATGLVVSGFAEHALEHVVLGMLGPAVLVFGAPVTLLLASLPRRHARSLATRLRSRPARTIAHPATAAVLNVGGMALLYLSPLYAASETNPLLHLAVHVHLFVAGYLFAWSIAGVDPAPHRPRFALRLVVLALAAAAHAGLIKVMFGQVLPAGTGHTDAEIREGLQWMYYGADVTELLIAIALFAAWYRSRRAYRVPRTVTQPAARTTAGFVSRFAALLPGR